MSPVNPDRARELLREIADDDTARVIWTEHVR